MRPARQAGQLVLCDRYFASSLVLQQMDGVSAQLVWQLNQHADRPDLCIILAGDPAQARNRAQKRGLYSRFHRSGHLAGLAEAAQYASAAAEMAERGFDVITHDIGTQTASEAAGQLSDIILTRWQAQANPC
ncbi:MAG: hypothetical protein ACRDNF_23025 [Streptosporangiaceae bacterium]